MLNITSVSVIYYIATFDRCVSTSESFRSYVGPANEPPGTLLTNSTAF